MRKVKFKKYNKAVPNQLGSKGGWDEDFIHEGVFHQWGSSYEDFGEQGAGNYSVALVEDEHGLIHEVLPSNVKFEEGYINKQREFENRISFVENRIKNIDRSFI